MREFIGVSPHYRNRKLISLKQQLLLFDKIAAPDLNRFLNYSNVDKWHKDELINLIEKEKIFHVNLPFDKFGYDRWSSTIYNSRNQKELKEKEKIIIPEISVSGKFNLYKSNATDKLTDDPLAKLYIEILQKIKEGKRFDSHHGRSQFAIDSIEFAKLGFLFQNGLERHQPKSKYPTLHGKITQSDYKLMIIQAELSNRLISIDLRKSTGQDVVPCVSNLLILPPDFRPTEKSHVVNVAIKEMPSLLEDTPWESIFEFKADEDVQYTKNALRIWMSKLVREKYSISEVEEEFNHLLNKYRKHMKIHKIKHKNKKQEVLIKLPFGITEDLLKVRLEKLINRFFEVRLSNTDFTQAELNCPGQEVAYIVKARKHFENN